MNLCLRYGKFPTFCGSGFTRSFWKWTPAKSTGRKRVHPRGMLDGIIFRMLSGCYWNRLPRELGDDSTIHRTFHRWVQLGVLERIWAELVAECEELGAVEWEWQAAPFDKLRSAMSKARYGGIQQAVTHGPGQGGQQTQHPG